MVHELRIHAFWQGRLAEYLELAGGLALTLRGDDRGVLDGFWLTRKDDLDAAVHLWTYESLDHRQAARERLAASFPNAAQRYGGIAPWLNSVTVPLRAEGQAAIEAMSREVLPRERLDLRPSDFSPLQ